MFDIFREAAEFPAAFYFIGGLAILILAYLIYCVIIGKGRIIHGGALC